MCYDIASGLKARIKYAKYRGEREEEIQQLILELENLSEEYRKLYVVSGFEHPKLLVFTNKEPMRPQLFQWGLIPSWIQDQASAHTIANQTLNARIEGLYDKPSFRHAARFQRCIILVDAYYEYHHYKGKTYPFRISSRDGEPFAFAGLWEEWLNKETGELIPTVTIVTMEANELKKIIHNNPKLTSPRMPLILSKEMQDEWLNADTPEKIKQVAIPFPPEKMDYHTVRKLKGKTALGNIPEAEEEFIYPELNILKYQK
jgi:putative SOS response-associated peptidase YedK